MADAEAKAKAEKLAAARKRVGALIGGGWWYPVDWGEMY